MKALPKAVVRPMRPADIEVVVAIETEAFTSPWQKDTFEGLLDRDPVEILVLDDPAEGIVGYAVLWCIQDQGELANLAIRPEFRGMGLGARLLEYVIETARARGVEVLYLEVRTSNQRAIELYEGFGFGEVGRRRGYYRRPREDALVMSVRL